MSDDAKLNAYFERIGFSGSIAPNIQTLDVLHRLHPASIPYENLDTLMGLPVSLDLRAVEAKLLNGRRGGNGFEHNRLFLAVLTTLGFEARAHRARVLSNGAGGESSASDDHTVITVNLVGITYLADVGLSGPTLTAPLKLRSGVEQETPHGLFRLTGDEPIFTLEAQVGNEWRPFYSFDAEEPLAGPGDAGGTSSRPSRTLLAARALETKRFTLVNTRLTTYPIDGPSETVELTSVEEIREALATVFGIALPSAELLDPALSKVLAPGDAQA